MVPAISFASDLSIKYAAREAIRKVLMTTKFGGGFYGLNSNNELPSPEGRLFLGAHFSQCVCP